MRKYITQHTSGTFLTIDQRLTLAADWLAAQSWLLPRQVTVDGKFIKEVMGVVSAVDVASGATARIARTSARGDATAT